MYNPITTEDFDKWIKADSREFEVKCEYVKNGTTYTMVGGGESGQIISMEWNNVVCSNDGLQIGTCCMDEFKMTYRNSDDLPSLMNLEIHPYVGLVCPHENTGDVTVWCPLGVFYVTNTETSDEEKTFTLTAYDGMQYLMGDFNANTLNVTFPINAWTLLSTIATHFGLTLSYDEELFMLLSSDDYMIVTSDNKMILVHDNVDANRNVQVEQPLEGTYRDYIGWIAGLVGANAHMGRSGELKIYRYTYYGMDVPRSIQHMGGTQIKYGGSVTYTSMISGTEENPVYPTSYSGNAITYSNPFIDVNELDLICDKIIGEDGITITPCDIAWRSDPRLDAGDIIHAEDKDGNYFPVYVMERVVNITGGLSETLHCYVETEIQKALNKSPLVTKLTAVSKTALEASDYINNTEGTFEFIDNGDGTNGGFTIYENGSSSWLRCTAGGIGISPDGGYTYTNAITKNGVVASRVDVEKNGYPLYKIYYDETDDASEIEMYHPRTNKMVFTQHAGEYKAYYDTGGGNYVLVGDKSTEISLIGYDGMTGADAITILHRSAYSNDNTTLRNELSKVQLGKTGTSQTDDASTTVISSTVSTVNGYPVYYNNMGMTYRAENGTNYGVFRFSLQSNDLLPQIELRHPLMNNGASLWMYPRQVTINGVSMWIFAGV